MKLSELTRYICHSQLNQPHIRYKEIADIIDKVKESSLIEHSLAGQSFEHRAINLFKIGTGKTKILAWSQMHGDEATATASLMDLLSLIDEKSDLLPNDFESEVSLFIVPMLNPDGAHRCTRENAQSIDINRDALKLETPEGNILMELVNSIKPDIALNLHDQCPYYQCGTTGQPSTLAFLAPAYDTQKSENKARTYAMQLIGNMIDLSREHIGEKIAKYDDTYSPRCFGDQISGKEISTILIESGAHPHDPNRQIARALNTKCIIEVIRQCCDVQEDNSTQKTLVKSYKTLPFNQANKICALKIKNLNFNQEYHADISIVQTSRTSGQFVIKAVGDLDGIEGLETLDARAYEYQSGNPYLLRSELTIDNRTYLSLLKKGYSHFVGDDYLLKNNSDYDILLNPRYFHSNRAMLLNAPAYGLIENEGNIEFALLNGQLVNLHIAKEENEI